VPPRLFTNAADGLLLHTVNVPFVPASALADSVTVTVAVAFVQGAIPVTV
jgi:hypothetical protein